MRTLVIVEHDGTKIRTGARCAVEAARDLAGCDGRVELLVLGHGLDSVIADAVQLGSTIVAESPVLEHPTADVYARAIARVCESRQADMIVAASTSFSKDIIPRAAALLNAAMVSDVTGHSRTNGELLLQRPMYAGGVTATVALVGRPFVITVRASAFSPAKPANQVGDVTYWQVDEAPSPRPIKFVRLDSRTSHRPDVTEARVVVSGGRAFRSSEEFEQCVGRLADVLGGATGCTRALVDCGIAPNEWQVGQTGKIVSPDLYFALGISGAVQHLAGMKGSRVVVAINSDPDAPIFAIANYGIVGDVRELVPHLVEEIVKNCH